MSEPALAPKEGAARVACWVTLLLSTALYFRADHVWRECGYDCAIFGEGAIDGGGWGPAAIGWRYLAVILILVSAAWLATSHVREWRQKRVS